MTEHVFETERLYFREPTLKDAPAMQFIKEANWPELQKWMNWAADDQFSMDATKTFIEKIVPAERQKGSMILFAFHKGTDDLVMIGGLNMADDPHVYSTGYWGNIDYLGQGYATEMTLGTLHFAFNQLNAMRVDISYYDNNIPSRRVIEKCGFEFVKTLPKNHKCFANGEMMDEHCYAMTLERWRGFNP